MNHRPRVRLAALLGVLVLCILAPTGWWFASSGEFLEDDVRPLINARADDPAGPEAGPLALLASTPPQPERMLPELAATPLAATAPDPARTIFVEVVDEHGRAVPDAPIVLLRRRGLALPEKGDASKLYRPLAEGRTDVDGGVALELDAMYFNHNRWFGLWKPRLMLSVFVPGYVGASEELTERLEPGMRLALVADAATLSWLRDETLVVRTVGPLGAPLGGILIELVGPSGQRKSGHVRSRHSNSETGEVRHSLRELSGWLRKKQPLSAAPMALSVRLGGDWRDKESGARAVSLPFPSDPIVFQLGGTGDLRLRLRDPTGSTDGALISWRRRSGGYEHLRSSHVTELQESGDYMIRGLGVGWELDVFVRLRDGRQAQERVRGPQRDGETAEASLELPRLFVVRGQLRRPGKAFQVGEQAAASLTIDGIRHELRLEVLDSSGRYRATGNRPDHPGEAHFSVQFGRPAMVFTSADERLRLPGQQVLQISAADLLRGELNAAPIQMTAAQQLSTLTWSGPRLVGESAPHTESSRGTR